MFVEMVVPHRMLSVSGAFSNGIVCALVLRSIQNPSQSCEFSEISDVVDGEMRRADFHR